MAKVTVLMAVYNAAPYLNEAVQSVLRQTLHDVELICVDDFSSDGSRNLLADWQNADSRVRVISLKRNMGQAVARNIALCEATGEYVCMLDADDWLSDDALERAVEVLDRDSEVDSVLFDVEFVYPDGGRKPYVMPDFSRMDGMTAFRLSLTWTIHGLYMIRAGLHKRYPYDTTCRLYSDDNTTRVHYLASRNVGHCHGVYHYRQHPKSATHGVHVLRFDYLKANESMARTIRRLGLDRDIQAEYENVRWLNLVDTFKFYYCNHQRLGERGRRYGLWTLRNYWRTIDRSMLSRRTVAKFGYWPTPSWKLFCIQEWTYFTLRSLLGRNQ